MKFKIEVEAQNGNVKREYIVEASSGEEFSKELERVERIQGDKATLKYQNETGRKLFE